MERTVRIGCQDFERIRKENLFYVDKTDLIRQWWEAGDDVTLITRPRRFGKMVAADMIGAFFGKAVDGSGQWIRG